MHTTAPRSLRLGLLLLAVFAVLTFLVESGLTATWDRALLLDVLPWRTPGRTTFFQAVSYLGVGEFAIPAGLLIFLGLRLKGLTGSARFFAWVTLGGWAFNLLLKQSISRARPDVIPHLGRGGWFTYPSGHSMVSPLVYGLGFLLLARLVTRAPARRALAALGVVISLAIACARVYLGVHYPSDVLGGLLAGCGWGFFWWGLKPPVEPAVDRGAAD